MAVYRKSLTVDSSQNDQSTGQITNLMSVDASRLQGIVSSLHAVWYSFLQIGLAIFFLWKQLGPSCLAGIAVIVICMPFTALVAQAMGRFNRRLMKAKDERIEMNNEVLGKMKIVKLQAWEEPFMAKIESLRNEELKWLLFYLFGRAGTFLLFSAVPFLVAVGTFTAYVLSGNALDVGSALTALALFDILRFPLFMLPNVVNNMVEASVAINRVASFLSLPDHQPVDKGDLGGVGATMVNASFVYNSKRRAEGARNADSSSEKHEKKRKETSGELSDVRWELRLIKSQLADAERELSILKGFEYDGGNGEELKNDQDLLSLKRVNFSLQEGDFIAVVGAVGSGKSTLLQAILGEVHRFSGKLSVNGKIAYFGQNPFIMNDTVKGNIFFGYGDTASQFNRPLYDTAILACSLEHDLQFLPNGDMCEIGEKGITLSGGQKARIAMARVLYHDADIFLLDDPLAAVDANVGRHLFEKCIVDILLENKGSVRRDPGKMKRRTVILVTNAMQYLGHPLINRIMVMEDGRIAEEGSYNELVKKGNVFKSLLNSFNETMTKGASRNSSNEMNPLPPSQVRGDQSEGITNQNSKAFQSDERSQSVASGTTAADRRPSLQELPLPHNKSSVYGTSAPRDSGEGAELENLDAMVTEESDGEGDAHRNNEKLSTALMTDEFEEREQGNVDAKIYISWAQAAGGIWVVFFILFTYILGESMDVLAKWWLAVWSEKGGDAGSDGQMYFLEIYSAINFAAVLTSFIKVLTVTIFGLKASRSFFTRVLSSTLKAPMSFFDTTPVGRIINRFSKDMYSLDEVLPNSFQLFLLTMFNVVSTVFVISAVTPIFLMPLLPIFFLYRKQQCLFTASYRELKRLDSVSRSPIYALFGETLDGVSTIRAFSAQDTLTRRMISKLDQQQHAYFLTMTAQCWLGVRLELIGSVITCFACLAVVSEHEEKAGDEVFAGLAGLSISYALAVTLALNLSVRTGSDLEANLVSVERLEQYCQMENEAPYHSPSDDTLDPQWPRKGVIEFKGVKLRYRKGLPLVLKGLNVVIPSHSKVGVVGRTGAGKSTLMTALLRLVELDEGKLLIDGVDTRTLGLATVRSKIAVIPQDPVLFTGSIKSNLDPFDEYSEEYISEVLTRVGLMAPVSSSVSENVATSSSSSSSYVAAAAVQLLSDPVLDGGSNFSIGEKQLLVIARALLCGAKVVICDEATASVDAKTDARIQRVLRTHFRDGTVLTVAHRLNTIMDSDYILVMSDGQAVEFDRPSNLLLKEDGLFKTLVDTWEEEHVGGD